MYENAGRSIKNVVSIVVKIGYAISGLSAIAILIIGLITAEISMIVAYGLVAIVVGVVGCLGAWLGGLWLYAYGEITERLISIDQKMQKLTKSEADTPAPAPAFGTTGSAVRPTATSPAARPTATGPAARPTVPGPAARTVASATGDWTCSCGRVNASYVVTCPCGINKREIQQ